MWISSHMTPQDIKIKTLSTLPILQTTYYTIYSSHDKFFVDDERGLQLSEQKVTIKQETWEQLDRELRISLLSVMANPLLITYGN